MQNMVGPQSETELDELASMPNEAVLEALSGIAGDIVVAGAGGKMGYHLCLMLRKGLDALDQKNRVVAVSRFGDAKKRVPFEERGIATVPCDLTKDEAVRILPEAEAVFYLAGQKFGTEGSPEVLHQCNVEMPARVANHYAESRIVALSTGCVYPFVSVASGGSRETDEVGPAGDYAASCLGREDAFVAASAKHGTALALIRLNYSVDLRYGVLVDIADRVLRGEAVDVSMGHLNCIWQGDATRHIIQSLGEAAAAPDHCIVNVTGAKILSVRELAQWFGGRFGKDVVIKGAEAEKGWLNDAARSHQLFGEPSVSEDELMEWVAQWMENGNALLGKPTHFEVRSGKY